MKYISLLAVVLLGAAPNLQAQITDSLSIDSAGVPGDSLYLNIVIPETDTVLYSSTAYRVAANTNPAAKAFINNRAVKVYESGAFVAMINHEEDTTEIEFKVVLNADTLVKTMYLVRPEPPKEINTDGRVITDRFMRPESNLWLKSGEVLEVQFLGSPGQQVVFNIDDFKRNIPMKEVPADIAGGVEGIYRGTYEVRPGDRVDEKHITFKMRRKLFGYHKRKSAYTVSFNGLPRVGEVVSDDAYLNIGMGTDRLGGARYGKLEKEVRLNIVGKKNNNYKVELSEGLDSWIPTRFVKLQHEQVPQAKSLTGNIRVFGNGNQDIITLSLSEKLPYTTFQQIDPNRVIVDVFGATSNTNWKTKLDNSKGIDKVEWEQVENDHFRLIITLNHSQNWGYSFGYGWGAQLTIKVNRPPVITSVSRPLEGRTIAVDAGHGGDNKGALGASGFMEKEITLQIAQKLEYLLKAEGVKVIMPRTDDSYVYMSDRDSVILAGNADLLVSIHANSIGYSTDPLQIHGTGAFYKHMAYKPLAEIMYAKMLELGLNDYGLTGSFNFSLNAPIEYPNVLVETAFISNPEEELLLIDPKFQERIASQIVQGLKEFYYEHAFIETVSDMPVK